MRCAAAGMAPPLRTTPMERSFLVLFFKKELLSSRQIWIGLGIEEARAGDIGAAWGHVGEFGAFDFAFEGKFDLHAAWVIDKQLPEGCAGDDEFAVGQAGGLEAVGVMYTAPADASPLQLNAIAPLSIATWHRHVDFCGGPKNLPRSDQFGPNARFGPQGSIHSEDACRAAQGLWIPVVFNWMTHVYPNEQQKWGGMDMDMQAGAPDAGAGP